LSLAFNIQCPQLKDGRQFESAVAKFVQRNGRSEFGVEVKDEQGHSAVAELINFT
jgi:hypothetical protein